VPSLKVLYYRLPRRNLLQHFYFRYARNPVMHLTPYELKRAYLDLAMTPIIGTVKVISQVELVHKIYD